MSAQRKAGAAAALVIAALLLTGFAFFPSEPKPGGDTPRPPRPRKPCPGVGGEWVFNEETFAWECKGGTIPGVIVDPTEPGGPTGPTEPTGPTDVLLCPPGTHPEGGVCVDDVVPPEEPANVDDIIKDFPEGGNFYQVKAGDRAYGTDINHSIAYRYLRREAFLAARDIGGQSDADAMIFAGKVANNNARRVKAWEIVLCSGANDAAYGTWGYCGDVAIANNVCPASMKNDPGPHGRAIRLLQQHPDNLSRIKNGQALARCIKYGSPNKAGNGSGTRADDSCDSYELLWMPQLDRQKLWDSGGTTVTADGVTWPDGQTKGLPPAFIMDRGLDFFDGSLPGDAEDFPHGSPKVWGCFDLKLVFE